MYCKNCFTDNTEIIPKTREEWTCHRNFRRPKQAASSTHSSLYSLNSFTYSYSGFPKDKSHSQGFSHENIRIMTADESTLQLIQLPGIEVCAWPPTSAVTRTPTSTVCVIRFCKIFNIIALGYYWKIQQIHFWHWRNISINSINIKPPELHCRAVASSFMKDLFLTNFHGKIELMN